MGNDDPREEVPMTAEAVEDVRSRSPVRDLTRADLQEVTDDGHRYGSLSVSPSPTRPRQGAVVEVPFRVELRPAGSAGPRRGA